MIKELNVYIDESGSPGISDADNFMLGAFLSERAIEPEIIQRAIDNLKKDKDFNEQDKKTFERGYFHASLDSKNAHSHICTQISSMSWPCELYVDVIDKAYLTATDTREIGNESKMHQHLLAIIGVHFTSGHFDVINFNVAERQGSFSESHKNQWENDFIDAMAYSKIQNPHIPISIPEFDVVIVDGRNPGIQICDFLLWAVQRDIFRDDSLWIDRSKIFKSSAYNIKDNPLSGNNYYLNSTLPDDLLLSVEKLPEPSEIDRHWNQKGIFIGMINIELQLKNIANHLSVIKNNVLKKRLSNLYTHLNEVALHSDYIIEMAKIYLLLADQVPFYEKNNQEEISLVYHYKKICSKAANLYNIEWAQFCNQWRFTRKWIHENDRNVLFSKQEDNNATAVNAR